MAFAQPAPDSTSQASSTQPADVTDSPTAGESQTQSQEDFPDPGPLFAVIAIFMFCLVLIGVGLAIGIAVLVVGAIIAAISAILAAVGIVSSSVLAGIVHRRPGTAVKAMLIQFGALAGAVCGVFMTGLADFIFHLPLTKAQDFWIGALGGVVGGAAVAILVLLIWSKIVSAVKRHSGKTV